MAWYTVCLTIWGIVSAPAGIAYGHYLVTRGQRKQWLREEYRELLGTLAQSALYIMHNSPHLGLGGHNISVKTGEQEQKSAEADVEARRVLQDRIFIAATVRDEKLLERWQLLMAVRDFSSFLASWREMHESIVKLAHADLGV